MLIRFYFYTFLRYYSSKQWASESIAAFRAVTVVAISLLDLLFVLFMGLEQMTGYSLFKNRVLSILFACGVFLCIYFYFISIRNSDVVSKEFEGHSLNKKENRRLCWVVFAFLFILPLALAVLKKYAF